MSYLYNILGALITMNRKVYVACVRVSPYMSSKGMYFDRNLSSHDGKLCFETVQFESEQYCLF